MPSQNSDEHDHFEGHIYVVDLLPIRNANSQDFDGREWLEHKLQSGSPVGWDIEWNYDQYKGQDNPVALMQFATTDAALLLRTHRAGAWLPQVVKTFLTSKYAKKICVGYDGSDRRKMQNSFGFEPSGIIDLQTLCVEKGLQRMGLKRLADHFGFRMKKDSDIATSRWASFRDLSRDQVLYAAEDAYFTFVLYDKLRSLPDYENTTLVHVGRLRQANADVSSHHRGFGSDAGKFSKIDEPSPKTLPTSSHAAIPSIPPMPSRPAPDAVIPTIPPMPSRSAFASLETTWELYKDPEAGRPWLWCAATGEAFFVDRAAAAGWEAFKHHTVGEWWWHSATGRCFLHPRLPTPEEDRSSVLSHTCSDDNTGPLADSLDSSSSAEPPTPSTSTAPTSIDSIANSSLLWELSWELYKEPKKGLPWLWCRASGECFFIHRATAAGWESFVDKNSGTSWRHAASGRCFVHPRQHARSQY